MEIINFGGKIPKSIWVDIAALKDNESTSLRFVLPVAGIDVNLAGSSAYLHVNGFAPFAIAGNVQPIEDVITLDYNIPATLTAQAGQVHASLQFVRADEVVWCTTDMVWNILARTDTSDLVPTDPLPDLVTQTQAAATYAEAQGTYANTQGDYAKAQGDYAKTAGDYLEMAQNEFVLKSTKINQHALNGDILLATDDISEGAYNLYYTEVRADSRIAAQRNAAGGIAGLDTNARIDTAQLPENLILDQTFAADWISGIWTADPDTDTLTCSSPHGLSEDDPVEFDANTGVLPAPLLNYNNDDIGGMYYNVSTVVDAYTIQVTATINGSAENLTDAGTAGWRVRKAGMSFFTVSGLDLDADKKYIMLLSDFGYAKTELNSAYGFLNVNGVSTNKFLTTWTGTYAANVLYFSASVTSSYKYSVTGVLFQLNYVDVGTSFIEAVHVGQTGTADKSTGGSLSKTTGGMIRHADNITQMMISSNDTTSYFIRNGVRFQIWRGF